MNDDDTHRIERLSSVLVDLLTQLDEAVDPDVTPHARMLARRAREAGERLVEAVKQAGLDAASLDRAERMAACAFELDRDINGGTLQ